MSYISLLELNRLVKDTLSARLEPTYWVVAEIGEMRLTQKGHCYLELIEKEGNFLQAKIRATLWNYHYRRLSGWFRAVTGEELKAGMKILSQVEVSFHELYGLSLNIRDIDANFTLGERARKKQEVLGRLAEEGVLEMNKSLMLPLVPQKIAVISSPTAAGLGDFMDQLAQNRYAYQFEVKLFQSLMQGNEAETSMIEAMHLIFQQIEADPAAFDVVVIIRGGGAQVDLDCFDSYDLCAHLAQFPIPVITGIGHERDETVADMVAHTRMKTPTAVAEFLINGALAFEEKMEAEWHRLSNLSRHILSARQYELDSMLQRLRFSAFKTVQKEKETLRQASRQIRYASTHKIRRELKALVEIRSDLKSGVAKMLVRKAEKLRQYEKFVQASDPVNIYKKGFTYTLVNGRPLADNNGLQEGDEVETRAYQQVLISRLEKIKHLKQHERKEEK